ncbi:MAG TPA: VWA-like domain-containing protein [Rhodocyclaceae bacterium]|nr:VWA-like domain-containing protein [Rhodocyclaceae bacterium]
MTTPTEITNKILAARTSLLWDHPFFGALAVQLLTVDATDDPRITTMATDSKHLFYDAGFVDKLTKDELIFVLAHEVLHNAFEHHIRRQARDPGRWNRAADYCINGELTETKVGTMPKGGLLDARFTGMGAEEVYRILEDEEPKGGGGGNQGGAPQGSDPGGCGGVIDACSPHDEAAIAEASAEMQAKVRQAAALAAGKAAGNLPAGVKRLIVQLTRAKVDWRALLRRFIDESRTKDYSWARPNRRFLQHGFILPGLISDGVSHLVVAVDTSGSIDDKALSAFAAEINGAFGDGMVDKITVIYTDTQVHRVEEYEAGDMLDLQPAGGGGTAFSNAFEWIAENCPDASAIAFFTDLEVHDFGDEPAAPVIWAVYGQSNQFEQLASKTPFGESVFINAA